jgi:hypothetical protein
MNANTYDILANIAKTDPETANYWRLVDLVELQHLELYADMLSRTKAVPGGDWVKLCGILHDWKTYRDLTDKQRRWLVVTVANHLDAIVKYELDLHSEMVNRTGFF